MSRARRPAQYLLRIDDLCPTVDRARWLGLLALVREFGIQPILAVVPENRDPELAVSRPDPGFWETMRQMQREGAVVALHGYQHLCMRSERGLFPLSRGGEFAGVPLEIQHERVRRGLAVLRSEGMDPRLWVAPRHNFDANTLLALRAEGIQYLSDGLTPEPSWRKSMVWIPQQLWGPAQKERGLWTICVHPNTLDGRGLQRLRGFFEEHAGQFTSFDRVVNECSAGPVTWAEMIRERLEVERMRLRRDLRARNWMGRSGERRDEGPEDAGREIPIG